MNTQTFELYENLKTEYCFANFDEMQERYDQLKKEAKSNDDWHQWFDCAEYCDLDKLMKAIKSAPLAYIENVTSENTGGGCMVDLIHLQDGRVIGINDEYAVLYRSTGDFWNADGSISYQSINLNKTYANDSVYSMLEEVFTPEFICVYLSESQLRSLIVEFPADSYCGKECRKVIDAYKLIGIDTDQIKDIVIEKVLEICFG